MAILDAMRSAAIRLNQGSPTAFFTSANAFEVELCDLVTETAVAIVKAHDWRKLTKLATLSGDGTTVNFSLPAGYDRMPVKNEIHAATWSLWRFCPARDLDQWLDFQSNLPVGFPGVWIMLGGEMHIFPAMPSGEQAKFYYISNYLTADPKSKFTSDSDVFLLDERLLTLGLIWRWRAQKRMEYSEDMQNYEVALSEAIGRDKGARMLTTPRRLSWDANVAYPRALGS